MEALKQRLSLREHQISDMKSQINDIMQETFRIDSELSQAQQVITILEEQVENKEKELNLQLELKEHGLLKLQELESFFEKPKETKPVDKNQDVATAYIEFYTRTIQSKPMFKKLPEFHEEPEPSSPQKLNDIELDEELEKLGLSDVLKKYS